jgi:Tfp pilus assembly protein PilO
MRKRAPLVLMAVLLVAVILKYFVLGDRDTQVVASQESAPMAEKRLANMRKVAATVPGKEEVYKTAAAELAGREQGLIKAGTVQQAQVALGELVQTIARSNGVDARGIQEFREKVLNKDYGEVSVAVQFTCGIEQLVNLLTAIGNQPQILATNEIHVTGGNDKQKRVQVRLSVSAAVPRKLLPEKKGGPAF